ncbi:MAG: ATP-dependent metallopeptidase FtsH/Yme1/Tma family protein, partial [Acidiferrobacterales bacterium]
MNNLTKNLLLWLVIAVVLMSVFNNFGNRQTSVHQMAYSQFYSQLLGGQVSKVTIEGRKIQGITKSGDKFNTYSP